MSAPPRSHRGRCRAAPGSLATSCSSIPSSSHSSACRSCSRTAGCHRPGSVGSCGSRSPAWSPGPSRACCSIPPAQPRIPGDASLALATPVLQALFPVLQVAFFVSVLVGFGGAVIAVSQRYRRGGRVQRQQVKWLTADVALAAILLPSALLLTGVNPELASTLSGIAIIAMFALPVVIGIAILRYRLYEIDRIISRTLGWAIVTALLAGGVRRRHRRPAGGAGAVHEREHDRRGGLHPRRLRAVPAAPPAGPARRGPPVRPGALRRPADGGRLRGARPVQRRSRDAARLAGCDGERSRSSRPGLPSGSARDGRDDRSRRSRNVTGTTLPEHRCHGRVASAAGSSLLWILGMVSLGLSLWASAALVPGTVTWQEAVWALLFGSAFLAVGAILVVRRPAATVGRICLLTGLTMAAAADLRTFAILLDRQPGPDPPDRRGRREPLVGRHLVRRPCPGRRSCSRASRTVAIADALPPLADVTVVLATLGLLARLFVPGPIDAPGFGCRSTNPSGIDALARVGAADLSRRISLAVYGVSVIASAAILVRRYRRSGPVVRAQIRWVAAAGIVPIVLFLALLGVGNADPRWRRRRAVVGLDPVDGPAADRDRRSRSCATGCTTSTGSSAARSPTTIVTGVLGPDIRGHDPRTAGGARPRSRGTRRSSSRRRRSWPPRLFQPLRGRVQRAVDLRFDRARVDGERTSAAFADRIRDEVEIQAVATELAATVDRSIRPASQGLWLRGAAE